MEQIEGTPIQQQDFERKVSRYDAAMGSLEYEPEQLIFDVVKDLMETRKRLSDHVEADLMTIAEANEIMEEYRRTYDW